MKPARDWQTEMVQSKQLGGDFVPWIEAIQRDALDAAACVMMNNLQSLMPCGEFLESTASQPAATDGTANHTARTE